MVARSRVGEFPVETVDSGDFHEVCAAAVRRVVVESPNLANAFYKTYVYRRAYGWLGESANQSDVEGGSRALAYALSWALATAPDDVKDASVQDKRLKPRERSSVSEIVEATEHLRTFTVSLALFQARIEDSGYSLSGGVDAVVPYVRAALNFYAVNPARATDDGPW